MVEAGTRSQLSVTFRSPSEGVVLVRASLRGSDHARFHFTVFDYDEGRCLASSGCIEDVKTVVYAKSGHKLGCGVSCFDDNGIIARSYTYVVVK
ncbi:MAG: hypothetical protein LLG14_00880 [Nocardiaceae bacterium]|nr:hypothetical protein [Nocardiaceae bacterium]